MSAKKGMYAPQSWEIRSDTKHWTRLFDDMLISLAFLALSPNAKILYFYLKREYKGPYNKITDTVVLPYTQAVKLTGIRRGNLKKCFEELEHFGFIKTKQIGGLYRVTNQYTLIKNWQDISEEDCITIKDSIQEEKKSKAKVKKSIFDFNP